jgi:hypothetical protein
MEQDFKTRKRYQVAREVTRLKSLGVSEKEIVTIREGRFFVVKRLDKTIPGPVDLAAKFEGLKTDEDFNNCAVFLAAFKKEFLENWAEKFGIELDRYKVKKELILQLCDFLQSVDWE